MKKNIIFLIILLISTNSFLSAQNKKHCETPNENQLSLNSISKCSIEQEDSNEGKVVLNVFSSRKVRKRIVRKRTEANSINNTNNLQKEIESNSEIDIQENIVARKVVAKEILFSVVDNVPLFPTCENTSKDKSECFNNQFSKHFAKNFSPEQASEEGVSGRVFIQFTIDIHGNVNNITIKSRKKDTQLEAEINRVIKKLPKFTPGKHQGLAVNVKYSLPINFSVD